MDWWCTALFLLALPALIQGQQVSGNPVPDRETENPEYYDYYDYDYNITEEYPTEAPVTESPIPIGLHDVNFVKSRGIAKTNGGFYEKWGESFPPINAFGMSPLSQPESSFWHAGEPYTVPKSLWFEFLTPIQVVAYSFTSRDARYNYGNRDGPTKYIFWASNSQDCGDEAEWVILHQDDSGREFTDKLVTKTEEIQNSQSYRCYGFKVTEVPGRDGVKFVAIGNVHFYSPPVPTTTPAPCPLRICDCPNTTTEEATVDANGCPGCKCVPKPTTPNPCGQSNCNCRPGEINTEIIVNGCKTCQCKVLFWPF